jgi:site-specific DNA-methyltransferase (adenine-specific)
MIFEKISMLRKTVRYHQQFEYMFVFSKGKPTTVNLLREPCKNAGQLRKRTCRDNHVAEALGSHNKTHFSMGIVADTKIRGNVWRIKTAGRINPTKHPAPFPFVLATDHILSWSNECQIVFDPMMGSATTGVAALSNNRKFIGYELSPAYTCMASSRLKELGRGAHL